MAIVSRESETEILILLKDGTEVRLKDDPSDPYDLDTLEKIWREI